MLVTKGDCITLGVGIGLTSWKFAILMKPLIACLSYILLLDRLMVYLVKRGRGWGLKVRIPVPTYLKELSEMSKYKNLHVNLTLHSEEISRSKVLF